MRVQRLVDLAELLVATGIDGAEHLGRVDASTLLVEGEVDGCAAVAFDGLDHLEVVGTALDVVVRTETLGVEFADGEAHDVFDGEVLVDPCRRTTSS